MTTTNNYQPDSSQGNGVTTVFTGDWSPIVGTYMRVYLQERATGILSAALAQGGGANEYTLSFSSSGYMITMGTAPSSLYNVVRARDIDLTQIVPFGTAVGFQGKVLENSLDKLTAIAQDNSEINSRTLSVPIGDTAASLVYPPAASRALKYSAFSADGSPIAVAGTGDTTPISVPWAAVVSSATLAAGKNAGGIASSGANNDITSLVQLSTILDALFGNTRGSVIYRGNAAWAALAPGTAGQFLRSAGAGADPTWLNPPNTRLTQTAQQTITQAGALTIAHGLGSIPTRIDAFLVNVTGEGGFSSGNIVPISVTSGGVGASARGMAVVLDATNINIRFANQTSVYSMPNFGSGADFPITNANWKVFLIVGI